MTKIIETGIVKAVKGFNSAGLQSKIKSMLPIYYDLSGTTSKILWSFEFVDNLTVFDSFDSSMTA